MTIYNRKNITVNGVKLTLLEESEKKKFQKEYPNEAGFDKVPNTSYYVYHPRGGFLVEDLIKLSGMEKYGQLDPASDVRLLRLPSNKKYADRAEKEGTQPLTFYPNNKQAKVTWVFPSDLKKMALTSISDALNKQELKGYNVAEKCCLKNKATASRSTFPKVDIRKMF